MSNPIAKKVLLIGWDAADWNVINPLMDAGEMPALEKLVNNGVIGNILTLNPPLSPMLWTSIATGVKADKHGILGFTEPDPIQGGIRPVNGTSRKVKSIWNILNSENKKTNVISWWPSHPAEPINGAMVSNFYQPAKENISEPWGMYDGTIHPQEYSHILEMLRVHPEELTAAHILPFIPDLAHLDPQYTNVIKGITKILAETATVQSATTWLMENTEWDFTAVYFDGIDHICHGFMKYHPPQMPGLPDDIFRMFKDVVNGMYKFHDMMLERLIQLAGPNTTIIIVSDHGFNSNHLRLTELPKYTAAPALEHRDFGIFCMSGPNIKKDERIYGATLLDITPTILSLFGLPIGKDMDGKVLSNAYENPIPLDYIDSWEKQEGNFWTYPEFMKENPFEAAEALKQLVELGYIEDPGEDKNKAVEMVNDENHYNLSMVYISDKRYSEAIEILEKLLFKNPDEPRYNIAIIECYISIKQFEKAQLIIDKIKGKNIDYLPNMLLLEGIIQSNLDNLDNALDCFKKVEEAHTLSSGLYVEIGRIYTKLLLFDLAIQSFQKALLLDEENAQAYLGLGICFLRVNQFENAADQLLNSIGLVYHFAPAHYHLGEAMYKMGRFIEASQAFEICLTMSPELIKAKQWLFKIYKNNIKNDNNLAYYSQSINQIMKGEIIIVSGLPRSGTSLMMQILNESGIKTLTDNIRKPDDNNPNGYFEFEKAKNIANDNSWLELAQGKVVKIISHGIQFLPQNFNYKIIFMQRDLNEIIKSQQKMLNKSQSTFPTAIYNVFKNDLEKIKYWTEKEPNVEIIYVNFADLFSKNIQIVEDLSRFLNKPISVENINTVINHDLYRNKIE
ncbi:MAG: alkaline phosphatase family protein [Bacteroidales bacterium]